MHLLCAKHSARHCGETTMYPSSLYPHGICSQLSWIALLLLQLKWIGCRARTLQTKQSPHCHLCWVSTTGVSKTPFKTQEEASIDSPKKERANNKEWGSRCEVLVFTKCGTDLSWVGTGAVVASNALTQGLLLTSTIVSDHFLTSPSATFWKTSEPFIGKYPII